MSDCELYNHHKSIFVAPNIKDIMLVAKIQHLYEISKKNKKICRLGLIYYLSFPHQKEWLKLLRSFILFYRE